MELRFQCQPGCVKCCDQEGLVYLSAEDARRAAKFVGLSLKVFEERYVYRTAHQRRFRKPPDRQCPFLENGGCGIHPAKPTQCRTYPFWPELIETTRAWKAAGKDCPGIGKGDLIQIGDAMEIAQQQRVAFPRHYGNAGKSPVKSKK